MRAMILDVPGEPLRVAEVPVPEPGEGQLLLRVHCCAVCGTDLHVVDGELPDPRLPLIPGHQIVGAVEKIGGRAGSFTVGDRVGVPWLGWTDGECRYCLSGRENLTARTRRVPGIPDQAADTPSTLSLESRFCFPIPEGFPDLQAAPLLCAGLIGHRSLRFAGDAQRLGLYGFRASAHIVAQVAAHEEGASSPSPARMTRRRRSSPGNWAPNGPGIPKRRHPRNWTRRSSSRPSAPSSPPLSGPSPGAGPWSARAYT